MIRKIPYFLFSSHSGAEWVWDNKEHAHIQLEHNTCVHKTPFPSIHFFLRGVLISSSSSLAKCLLTRESWSGAGDYVSECVLCYLIHYFCYSDPLWSSGRIRSTTEASVYSVPNVQVLQTFYYYYPSFEKEEQVDMGGTLIPLSNAFPFPPPSTHFELFN